MSSAIKLTPAQLIEELLQHPQVQEAFRFFEEQAEAITEEQIRICSIPAGPFTEHERCEYLRKQFLEIGLSEVEIDEEGNCIGLFTGASEHPLMVVSAHLDTVFSKDTDFTIKRVGQRLLAPGISDDGCGLVALLALSDALIRTGTKTRGSILFVGTVGEEGEGNLRGVRYLCTKGKWSGQIDAFLSFDGPGIDRITNQALGSHRYKVTLTGSGGHSWGDFGVPNPVHALGNAIAKLANYPLPKTARTTFNVGRINGGTSVNSIPAEASFDVDLRSVDEVELQRLDAYFRRVVLEAVERENSSKRIGDADLVLKLELVGERPSGQTAPDAPLVELAREATKVFGVEAQLDQASTDSNVPISLGIPSITIGAGGTSAGSHTLDEWYEPLNRDEGLKRGLLVVLGSVGLAEGQ
jgi:acetylornithine deacetylase/succinyl-diaminopimelate desuccinylase-like protein